MLDEANKKLIKLCNLLDFDCYIFDDPSLSDKNLLRYKKLKQEIDAVIIKDNIIFLVDIYSGLNHDKAKKKIGDFVTGLGKNLQANIIDQLEIVGTGKGGKQKKEAKTKLNIIKKIHAKIKTKNYYPIIKKVSFYPEIDITEEIEDYYTKKNHLIVDKELYTYFMVANKTLGADYLFKQIMSFANIKKVELNKKTSTGCSEPRQMVGNKVTRLELVQDKMIMYSSTLPVEKIVEFTTVFRIGQKKSDIKGFQRIIKEKRIKKIGKEYLGKSETFPNNIIIALDPETYKEEKKFYNNRSSEINLYEEFNSLLIIDGQHRFFSFQKAGLLDREVLITFIFFKNKKTAYQEMYKMFYKINTKQENIDASLNFMLKAMIDDKSEEAFWFNVFRKLNNTKGFFKNKVSFKEKQLRYRDEKGIISVIKYGGLLSLNKVSKKIPGLYTIYPSINKKERIIFAIKLLNNYFSIVANQLIKISEDKEYIAPREIGALIRLVRHFIIKDSKKLIALGKIKNINNVRGDNKKAVNYFRKILGYIDFKETVESDLSASNWAAVEGLMFKYIRSKKASFGDKKLLSKKGLDIYQS